MKWIVEAKSIDDIVLGRCIILDKPLTECKNCKWHNGEIDQCNAQICASMCDDDFCSRAERREE